MEPAGIDFNAATDDWYDIAMALRTNSAVVIRECLDPAMLGRLRRKVGGAFDRIDASAREGRMSEGQQRFRKVSVSVNAEEVFIPDGNAIALLTHPLFKTLAMLTLRADVAPFFAYFRRMDPAEPQVALPYHQDETVIARFWNSAASMKLLNVWVPLDPSGEDRPGLELLAQKLDDLITPGPVTDSMLGEVNTEVAESYVRETFDPSLLWVPKTQPGDVLVFHGTTLHRTALRPGMSADRISLDIRFMTYLDDHR